MSARPAGSPGKSRLDQRVVALGLAPTREKAQALIIAGRITVDGKPSGKPGSSVADDAAVELVPGARPYVSRGGSKLAGALDRLAIDPAGLRCLDVGASTGGFTDVLLRRGAAHVTALDVGRGLFDATLARDPRVTLVEEVNARYLRPEQVAPPYALATIDVSFIALALVLPAIVPLVPGGRIIALVKPQFESSPRDVGRGGVVRDDAVRAAAVARVAESFGTLGWGTLGIVASPLAGPAGNREIFLAAADGPGLPPATWEAILAQEVRVESP